jgi:hypothetical protein
MLMFCLDFISKPGINPTLPMVFLISRSLDSRKENDDTDNTNL